MTPRRVHLYRGPADGQTVTVDDAAVRHGTIHVARPPQLTGDPGDPGDHMVAFTEDRYRVDWSLPPLEGEHAVAVWVEQ